MGDRTWWHCYIPACDVGKARAVFTGSYYFEEEETDEYGNLHLFDDQANYGNHNLNQNLALDGVRFQGNHGAGGEYPEMVFVGWEGGLYEVCADDWIPMINHPNQLADLMNYKIVDEAVNILHREQRETTPEMIWPLSEPFDEKNIQQLLEEIRAITADTPLRVWAPLINQVARFSGNNTVAEQYLLPRLIEAGMVEAASFAAVQLAERRQQERKNEQQATPPQAPP